MPDMFGNPTPQELLGQFADENALYVSQAGGNADARRNAILYTLGRNMTAAQDPRMVQATERDNAIRQSLAIKRADGESALDFEIRKGRALFEGLKSVDPTAASEVSSHLVKLEDERMQREHLLADRKREDIVFEQEQDDRAQLKGQQSILKDLFYEYDPATGKVLDVTTNLEDPDH
jgi:hypothetical protein